MGPRFHESLPTLVRVAREFKVPLDRETVIVRDGTGRLILAREKISDSAHVERARTVQEITKKYSGSSAPIDLVIASILGSDDDAEVLTKLLRGIGVFEERSDAKINVPDIFRVKAGILRKGGVTPQQRRRL